MSCKANSLILINLKTLFDVYVEEERELYDLDTGTITTKLDADLLFLMSEVNVNEMREE